MLSFGRLHLANQPNPPSYPNASRTSEFVIQMDCFISAIHMYLLGVLTGGGVSSEVLHNNSTFAEVKV
jgi:hypothetical protein